MSAPSYELIEIKGMSKQKKVSDEVVMGILDDKIIERRI